ncbi:hypothetical protein SAMN04490248_101273 [Salinihabitans flavidus]|uniref:Uncharacterized protein n=2 Tax=Salinihabitans flavidus TaxID=569882 RepID=A0A1H8LSE9_9RHOB|nr:hypothetical protein SAMN04490248_101273 [Salinihabitans flavidus]
MEEDGAIFLDLELPEGALLRWEPVAEPVPGAEHPNTYGAVWYAARGEAIARDGGAVIGWTPENGLGIPAVPVTANAGGGLSDGGGLRFEREVNAGLVAENALVDARHFTVAVRFESPEHEARTLVTLNPGAHDNYLFLSEKEGTLIWEDEDATAGVRMPSRAGAQWVAASYALGALSLSRADEGGDFEDVQSGPASLSLAAAMAGASDLFIGCRSHRKGIVKTLGASVIHDILFWIDADCLATPEGRGMLTAACRHVEGADA